MATVTISEQNFREIYQTNDIVVLDFWASWCGPCQQFAPVFEQVSEKYPEIVFGKVDTEAEEKLSSYFEIRSIPTIIIIREQLEVFRHSGTAGSQELQSVIEQIQAADMDEVKKKLGEE